MFTITCLEHCLLLTVKMTVKNILTCGAGWWIQVCKVRTCRGATLKICIKGRTWYTDSVRRLTQLDTPQTRGRQPLCDTTPCLGPRHDTHRHSQCCGASEGFILFFQQLLFSHRVSGSGLPLFGPHELLKQGRQSVSWSNLPWQLSWHMPPNPQHYPTSRSHRPKAVLEEKEV